MRDRLRTRVYARRADGLHNVFMHRELMKAPRQLFVDHINGNTLDNRRQNLRLCTNSQNQANRRVITARSGYKGVYFNATAVPSRPWMAKLSVTGQQKTVGYFATPEAAAAAYDAELEKHFGEFAATNAKLKRLSWVKSIESLSCLHDTVSPARQIVT
jgi:hypothetical protein